LLAGLLGVGLAVHVPAFLCMPLNWDSHEWDLCTRTVLDGGVLYRDALENNLPGTLWLHAAVRGVAGWRSEVLRAADLLVLAAVIALLPGWLPAGASTVARVATAGLLASFYLWTSEWCHCQRDPWMLLPAQLALGLRLRQRRALLQGDETRLWLRPLLEGMLWGAAFWIKPYVAVPALACWLAAGRGVRPRGRLVLDGLLLIAGGLLVGAAGSAWLIASGAWPSFWEVMLVWNREYVAGNFLGEEPWAPLAGFLIRLFPWALAYAVALPVACRTIWRAARQGGEEASRDLLLSALFLGWLLQAVVLQHLYDYVHVPGVLLALTLLCRRVCAAQGLPRALLVGFLLLGVAVRMPALTWQRLALWEGCVREGSTPEVRDRLQMLRAVAWTDMDRVRAFLHEHGARDGEVSCYNRSTLPLYAELRRRPASRHFLLENIYTIFTRQRSAIHAELTASNQRYLVCDLATTHWKRLGPAAPVRVDGGCDVEAIPFPRERLIFRAGRYGVYAVDGPSMPAWLEANLFF
jgi:hypothetical protein